MKNPFKNWKWYEFLVLFAGELAVVFSFVFTPQKNWISFVSSLLGIFCVFTAAKGLVISPIISLIFSALYAVNAYNQSYFGETIIYVFLMIPLGIFNIVTWLKNKNPEKKSEVLIAKIKLKEYAILAVVTVALTIGFYFLLKALDTSELIVSTISLSTSVVASYLMLRRSEYYAIGFVLNDIVLIVLWGIASATDLSLITQVVCFAGFLINDAYGFIRWKIEAKRQIKK